MSRIKEFYEYEIHMLAVGRTQLPAQPLRTDLKRVEDAPTFEDMVKPKKDAAHV